MSSIFYFPEIILENVDPDKKPEKPEPPLNDYDDLDLEGDCLVCGKQNGVHTRSDVCNCMSKEVFE